jgi:hypothetical protein
LVEEELESELEEVLPVERVREPVETELAADR